MTNDEISNTIQSLVSANQALMTTLNILTLTLRQTPGFNSQKASMFLQRFIEAPAAHISDRETYEKILHSYLDLLVNEPTVESAVVIDFPGGTK